MKTFLDPADEQDALTWDSLTVKDGLPHNWIYDLFEDSAGRMWVGTWGGGLGMYDGDRWTIYDRGDGLASDNVTCIREDGRHRIWVATDSGMNRFDGAAFVNAGLEGKSILNICFDRAQNLWAGCWRVARSGGGLYLAGAVGSRSNSSLGGIRWQDTGTRQGAPGLEILKVFEDSSGRIWVGTYDYGRGAGVGCWDGSEWHRFTRRDGLIGDCVYSMFEDPNGHMWFGTTKGISVYDGTVWHRLTKKDGLINNKVYAMFIDADKKMWFGTGGGVGRFDGKTWQAFTRKNELTENLVRTITQDREGRLWFGTYPFTPGRGGISRARATVSRDSIESRMIHYLESGPSNRPIESGD